MKTCYTHIASRLSSAAINWHQSSAMGLKLCFKGWIYGAPLLITRWYTAVLNLAPPEISPFIRIIVCFIWATIATARGIEISECKSVVLFMNDRTLNICFRYSELGTYTMSELIWLGTRFQKPVAFANALVQSCGSFWSISCIVTTYMHAVMWQKAETAVVHYSCWRSGDVRRLMAMNDVRDMKCLCSRRLLTYSRE